MLELDNNSGVLLGPLSRPFRVHRNGRNRFPGLKPRAKSSNPFGAKTI